MSLFILALGAQTLPEFKQKVSDFTLPNGLHFVLAERHDLPVVSLHTYVRAGAADDPFGGTGLAHLFERLALRGSENIGTKDWASEKKALDAVEDAYDKFEIEKYRETPDVGRLGAAEYQFKRAVEAAQAFVRPNEFGRILDENGATGIAANTTPDSIEYACSLPSNRLELWFLMESERLLRPAFREFYLARELSVEQYTERMQSNPQGRLTNAFLAAAMVAHPYRNPVLGWPSDITSLRRPQAREYFDRYYVPGNMTIAIAGDVNPAEARRLAEKYFGPMRARPVPPAVRTTEPQQRGPKIVAIESLSQPLMIVGYRRPSQMDPDDPVLDLLQWILAGGRSGLLSKELVEGSKVVLGAQAQATLPGGRYPSLFVFLMAPAAGHTVQETQNALEAILTRLGEEPVDSVILLRAKHQARLQALRRLESNSEVAFLLASYAGAYGDWRRLFSGLEDIDRVTAADVSRVARKYFTPNSRTTAYTTAPGAIR